VKAIEAMNAQEICNELLELNKQFTDSMFDILEHRLKLRAGCLHWTGDPLNQPPEIVLAEARAVIEKSNLSRPTPLTTCLSPLRPDEEPWASGKKRKAFVVLYEFDESTHWLYSDEDFAKTLTHLCHSGAKLNSKGEEPKVTVVPFHV